MTKIAFPDVRGKRERKLKKKKKKKTTFYKEPVFPKFGERW